MVTRDGKSALPESAGGANVAEDDATAAAASPAPGQVLLQAMTGYVVTQALYAAAALGIADHLITGAMNVDELARLTGSHPLSLARLMRALCSAGLFERIDNGFVATALGRCLVRDAPDSVRASVLVAGAEQYRAWGELLHSVQTGDAAFAHLFGTDSYTYLVQHPEAGRLFDQSMRETGEPLWPLIVAAYDFSAAGTVVDVGGGHGVLLATILQAYPAVRGILYDLPAVVAGAGEYLEAAGVRDRCTLVGGSFFDSVPPGGDVYLLARTLLNWNDGRVRTILAHCRATMAPGARLLLIEPVLPQGPVSFADAFNDLNLLVLGSGRMHTEPEFHELFNTAGFRLTRILPTDSRLSIIEAMRAEP